MRVRARWIALAVAVVLVAFGVVLAVQHRSEPSVPRLVQEHKPMPAFDVTTLDGKKVDAASLRDKTVVVNFFNSWCIPCQQEAPALASFYAEHKNDPNFAMLGVVRDDDPSAIRSYVSSNKIGWPVALTGADRTALDFGTTGQPETYVIAPDGTAVCGTLGPSTQAQLDTWIAAARAGQECT
jgi:cytochrome c biogenesis protein CcmG/thiol:disulfide interchange protein DsbE